MIINPDAAGDWTIHVRVTAGHPVFRAGTHQWAIWCGRHAQMIKILRATPGAFFDQGSKRWMFFKPTSEFGATMQKLMDLDLKIDWEDPRGK